MQFYDVKTRSKVEVADGQLTKKKFVRTTKNGSTQTRYAVRASHNGSNLTRFVTQDTFNSMDVPEDK